MNKHNGYMKAHGDLGLKLQTAAVKRCIQAFGKNWSHKAEGTVVLSTHGDTYTLTNPELVCADGIITIKFAGEGVEYQLGDLHNFQDALWLLEEALENKGHKKKRKEPSPQTVIHELLRAGRLMQGLEVVDLHDLEAIGADAVEESGEGLALCAIDFEGNPIECANAAHGHIPLSKITKVEFENGVIIHHPGHCGEKTVFEYYRELRAEELPLHLELNA